MKKFFVILFVLLLAFSLAACGTPQGDPDNDAKQSGAEEQEINEADLFHFTPENLPRLDGSTAMVPMGEAVVSAVLGISREEAASYIKFNRTTQSFRNLMNGECDLILSGEPQASVFEEKEEMGFDWEMAEIARDGLVFVVNADNPVDSLTTEELRGIYSGKITNWKELGGEDLEIIAFQRNEGAGSQALMKKHVMQGTELMAAPKEYIVDSMMGLMEAVRGYEDSAGAIGYSVYYYAHEMEMAEGLKIIAVDGVAPSNESIRSGEYPHINGCYAVIAASAAEDSPARILYNWLQSEEGQRLIDHEGYVSAMDLSAAGEADAE